MHTPKKFSTNNSVVMDIDTNACIGKETEVNYIEHVQAVITLNATRRGEVTLYLISPSGTRSMILSRRPNDDDHRDGFTKWPFMTTHTWGENPKGRWKLVAHIAQEQNQKSHEGWIIDWTLMVHGTKEAPYANLPPIQDENSKLAIVKKAHEDYMKKKH